MSQPEAFHSGPSSSPELSPSPSPIAHTLHIVPAGLVIDVPPGSSLLEAARAAGVRLPSTCRNGTCRACMARLVSGRVHYRIEWPGLSAEEKEEGYVLPCVALADSDVVLDQPALRAAP